MEYSAEGQSVKKGQSLQRCTVLFHFQLLVKCTIMASSRSGNLGKPTFYMGFP